MTLVNFNSKTRNSAPYFNNVFDSLFTDALQKNYSINKVPNVNILETEATYKLQLAAPGLQKEDFQINVKKDTLSVWTEKKDADMDNDQKYNRREFDFSSFARSFNLPEGADADQISAEYINGILTISIAKIDEKVLNKEIKVS